MRGIRFSLLTLLGSPLKELELSMSNLSPDSPENEMPDLIVNLGPKTLRQRIEDWRSILAPIADQQHPPKVVDAASAFSLIRLLDAVLLDLSPPLPSDSETEEHDPAEDTLLDQWEHSPQANAKVQITPDDAKWLEWAVRDIATPELLAKLRSLSTGRGWPKTQACAICGAPMTGRLLRSIAPGQYGVRVEWEHDPIPRVECLDELGHQEAP